MSCLVEFLDNLQAFIDVIETFQGGNQFFGFLQSDLVRYGLECPDPFQGLFFCPLPRVFPGF